MQISSYSKYLLRKGYDPELISMIARDPEKNIWEYLQLETEALRKEEQYYNEFEKPKLKADIEAFKNEFPLSFRKDKRVSYINQMERDLKKRYEHACMSLVSETSEVVKEHIRTIIEDIEKERNALYFEMKVILGYKEGIKKDMIAKARAYPLENLIEIKKNSALCPFHNEKTASFFVKNNLYKCFGCSARGDSIDLAIHLKNMTFKQAVEYLQN